MKRGPLTAASVLLLDSPFVPCLDLRAAQQTAKEALASAPQRHGLCRREYRLHAVFVHSGEAGSGHYWVYILDQPTQQWYKFNDTVVTKVDQRELFESSFGGEGFRSAYGLVYIANDAAINATSGPGRGYVHSDDEWALVAPEVRRFVDDDNGRLHQQQQQWSTREYGPAPSVAAAAYPVDANQPTYTAYYSATQDYNRLPGVPSYGGAFSATSGTATGTFQPVPPTSPVVAIEDMPVPLSTPDMPPAELLVLQLPQEKLAEVQREMAELFREDFVDYRLPSAAHLQCDIQYRLDKARQSGHQDDVALYETYRSDEIVHAYRMLYRWAAYAAAALDAAAKSGLLAGWLRALSWFNVAAETRLQLSHGVQPWQSVDGLVTNATLYCVRAASATVLKRLSDQLGDSTNLTAARKFWSVVGHLAVHLPEAKECVSGLRAEWAGTLGAMHQHTGGDVEDTLRLILEAMQLDRENVTPALQTALPPPPPLSTHDGRAALPMYRQLQMAAQAWTALYGAQDWRGTGSPASVMATDGPGSDDLGAPRESAGAGAAPSDEVPMSLDRVDRPMGIIPIPHNGDVPPALGNSAPAAPPARTDTPGAMQ